MRLPLVPAIESRDGTDDADGACWNMLIDEDDLGQVMALRPALERTNASSGDGKGMVEFNGTLISVYGSTLGKNDPPTSIGTITGEFFDFAESPR